MGKFNIFILFAYGVVIIMGLVSTYNTFIPSFNFGYSAFQTIILGIVGILFGIQGIIKLIKKK
jgi:hypothetical protein